jgi:diaminohydroxyphosphoribosylaminopyrimidine deaminase / 5-amino-6-(5-phosphoribosylamino)uracil reductase
VTRNPQDAPALLREAAERALQLGRGVAGTTAPNPPVGCVLVHDGRIVGKGATTPVGGPHAEILAIREAGERAVGATAVITLEPCDHVGRTGACTDALRAAGVTSVRYLVADPSRDAGGGAASLRAAGVDAASIVSVAPELADLALRAAHDLRGFLTLATLGRPHVHLKLAQLPDGRMHDEASSSRYLTGDEARHRVHELRADVDAVLVGSGTVRSDDPNLDARDVDAERQPRPVVFATGAQLPGDARVLHRSALVLVGAGTDPVAVRALQDGGAEVREVPTRMTDDGVRIDVVAALAALPSLGVLTVLAEPGPTLARALIEADVVDLVEYHVAAAAEGAAITPAIELDVDRFEPSDLLPVGPDLVVMARRRSVVTA